MVLYVLSLWQFFSFFLFSCILYKTKEILILNLTAYPESNALESPGYNEPANTMLDLVYN